MCSSAFALLRFFATATPAQRSASNAVLAKQISRCSRTVNRALADLVETGAITVAYQRTAGPGQVGRVVTLNTERVESLLASPDENNEVIL